MEGTLLAEEPASTPIAAPQAAQPARTGGKQMEADLEQYWGEKRKIRVVERQLHPKDSRHEFAAFGGIIPNDPFLFYYTVGGSYGFFAAESFSFEATYVKALLNDTELGSFLEEKFTKIDEVQENDRMEQLAHLDLVWTPFYGKMAFLSSKLVHFDLGLFLGAGWLNTTYYNQKQNQDVSRHVVLGNAGAGFRFHIMDYFTLRFDVHQYFFQKVQGGLSHPTMLSLGLSTLLPYPTRQR